ncbi:hypothetical protein V6N11_003672 [Hibiscus sabdariffa]|uniref:Uncharacterized protein n=1 Tax=Hibiscus sabdariffa TaxID=183260 RepID=A0ABR2SEV2_9ROSI
MIIWCAPPPPPLYVSLPPSFPFLRVPPRTPTRSLASTPLPCCSLNFHCILVLNFDTSFYVQYFSPWPLHSAIKCYIKKACSRSPLIICRSCTE